jgi:hypothetical protein
MDIHINNPHENQEISIVRTKNAITRFKTFSLKSMKDFQIRTEELGRRKHISVEPE